MEVGIYFALSIKDFALAEMIEKTASVFCVCLEQDICFQASHCQNMRAWNGWESVIRT